MVDTHHCSSDSHYVVAGNRTQDSSFSRHKLKVSRGARAIDSRMLHRFSMKHVSVSAERARRPLNPAASAAKPPAPAAQESGLAASTSVAAPADRKAATQSSHVLDSKLYTGLARTAWPCDSNFAPSRWSGRWAAGPPAHKYRGLARNAWPCESESCCVISNLFGHSLPCSTCCKQPALHVLVLF